MSETNAFLDLSQYEKHKKNWQGSFGTVYTVDQTFSECSSLKKVSIPPSINSILNDVLKGFSSLIEISSPTPQKLKQFDQNHHQQTIRNMKSKEKISEIDECLFGLLLCGPGECGKTTIIHQLKSKFSEDEISVEEKLLYAQKIKANLIESMQKLIYWTERNDKEISIEFEEDAYAISDMNAFDCEFTKEIADQLKRLFNDFAIQEALKHQEETNIQDNIDYFYSKIDDLVSNDYIPSYDDILHARVRSIGINEFSLFINGKFVTIFDVGGQKSERLKWNNVIDKVSGVIFCISLIDYDKYCFEDSSVLRITDALELFKEITHCKKCQNLPFFLIRNKYDAFQLKIEKTDSFMKAFPDYKGDPHNSQECKNYIIQKFIVASISQTIDRPIIVFTQSSFDINQVIQNTEQIINLFDIHQTFILLYINIFYHH